MSSLKKKYFGGVKMGNEKMKFTNDNAKCDRVYSENILKYIELNFDDLEDRKIIYEALFLLRM